MKKIILSIDGMTCSACSNGLEKYLNKQDGVEKASVNLVLANASIEYDEKKLNIAKLEEFVKKAGFKSLGEFKELKDENKSNKKKCELIISTILIVFLMYFSMGQMIGLPQIPLLDRSINLNGYLISLLVISIVFLCYGFDILFNGFKNLIHKTPNMDTLVGIGVITSFLYSLFNLICILHGSTALLSNLYFESTSMIIYFVKLGRYIEEKNTSKTYAAIQKLVKITPNNAVLKTDDGERIVTLDEIHKEDTVVCKPGEKIAVDGTIISGKAHIDESFITGESKPTAKEVGGKVLAGSINLDGYIEYNAERIGRESTVSEIVKLVVEATNTKAPIEKIVDKVSSYFVPIVIGIAIITFITYLILGYELNEAIISFVTVLVVTCPCSLGLATPLAIVTSEGKCASNGILIKKNEILENASKTKVVVFDKTGTLTYGKLKIAKINNYSSFDNDKLIRIIASLESKSTHPIANAFVDYLDSTNQTKLDVNEFDNMSGLGISGVVDNHRYVIGNKKILSKVSDKSADEKLLLENGNTVVYVVQDDNIIALIGISDIARNESKDVIKSLNEMNIEPIMLTGDNDNAANLIAKELNIQNVISNVLPKEKANAIKNLKEKNKFVMMCGDGINDSVALACADVGVSVGSGTDIAIDSSSVIITSNDLQAIPKLVKISSKTVRIIKQNLFWAFFYNALMIPIAIGFFKPFGISINPMMASVAMMLSSFTVVLNALRLRK